MEIRTETAIAGFLSRAPQLKMLRDDLPLLVAQLGQNHYRREDDGAYTQTGTDYIGLVMFGPRAQAAFERFSQGDDVVALGEFRQRAIEIDGQSVERTQFRATKLLFDTSHPRYTVSATERAVANDLGAPAPYPSSPAAAPMTGHPALRPASVAL